MSLLVGHKANLNGLKQVSLTSLYNKNTKGTVHM